MRRTEPGLVTTRKRNPNERRPFEWRAKRKPPASREWALGCNGCGEEFVIGHLPESMDKRLAEKQAHWLEKVLTEEHERGKEHPDRIELPE